MYKILFIIDDLGKGGAEKITVDLANYFSENNHSVTLAVLNSSKNSLSFSSHINYIDLHINKNFSFGKLWKYKKLTETEIETVNKKINTNIYDLIIIGHHNGYYLYDYLKQKNKIWHWIHAELLEFRPSNNPIKKIKEYIRQYKHKRKFISLFNNKKLITVNRDLEHKYKKMLPESKIKTIPNGVNPNELLTYSTSNYMKKWDVIFAGRLAKIKQVDHAIYAFKESGLQGRMAIIGDGNEFHSLQEYAISLNIDSRIDFLGWQKDPRPFIASSKCLVISSYYESFGLVLAESLMLGTPVVAYNCSLGVQDILSLQPDMANYLVTKQDKKMLAEKINQCVKNPYVVTKDTLLNLSLEKTAFNFLKLIDNNH